MGNKSTKSERRDGDFNDITERLEKKTGKIALSGRYHKAPNRLEDDYEVTQKVLGSGYNGVVRLATKTGQKTVQKFAVKTFKLANLVGEKRSQLQSEVEVFLCMDHPHITRLYDVYDSQDYLFLVMECMEGGELFDRIKEQRRFSERDAQEAMWQMLLAVNYLHSHGIVHRDLKLENFLYDKPDGEHLKLIDFGFSHMWDPNIKMRVSCGTLSYVAPEVLKKSYTCQCDLWSMGVIVFILLAGYMPFSGSEADQTKKISEGKYVMKPERWNSISNEAQAFTKALLQSDPEKRLTAEQALEHEWIKQRLRTSGGNRLTEVDPEVVDALRKFGQASRFRRCCLEMMAWSLSNEERAKVRDYFLSMDANKQGTITLTELKQVLEERFQVPDEETRAIFDALDNNKDEEIHYNDFLAAMVSTRIALHDDLLLSAFKKFDADSSGYITVENLRTVLGDNFEGEHVEKLLKEADILQDNRISYPEFVSYLRGEPLENHEEAALKVIEAEMTRGETSTNGSKLSFLKGAPMLRKRSDGSGRQATSAKDEAPSTDADAEGNAAAEQRKCFKVCVVS